MTTRLAGSSFGTPVENGTRVQNSLGARFADSGIPTVYHHCTQLNKKGQPCKAPVQKNKGLCLGHERRLMSDANQV